MNHYQKLATLLVRVVGSAITVFGAIGPLYIAVVAFIGSNVPTYGHERWLGSVVWTITGVLLIVLGKPLGRLFGHGLE